jgi:uncharacterized membrane protein
MHKNLVTLLLGLVILGAVLTIGQIWGLFGGWDFYAKIITTIAILVLLIGFVIVIKADLGEHKKLKDENYLD